MKRPFFKLANRSVSLLNTLVSDLDEDEKFEAVNAQVFKTMGALTLVLPEPKARMSISKVFVSV